MAQLLNSQPMARFSQCGREPLWDGVPGRQHEPPPPVEIEDELEWEVETILDSRIRRERLEYLVKWAGIASDLKKQRWKPATDLTNAAEIVVEFHAANPNKPNTILRGTPKVRDEPTTAFEYLGLGSPFHILHTRLGLSFSSCLFPKSAESPLPHLNSLLSFLVIPLFESC
jgi:Chromo (CHRromatin Organisation MOdifier) domain